MKTNTPAQQAQQSNRNPDGTYREVQAAENNPDALIRTDIRDASETKLADMDAIELNPPYPAADFAVGETALETYGDGVTCVCGNDTAIDGFSAADRTGRLASISLTETADNLGDLPSEDTALAICNACGRIYDDAHNDDAVSSVLGRVDTSSTEWDSARQSYLEHNFG
jgi:hypothetical protein